MRKISLTIVAALLLGAVVNAQTGKNQVGAGGELGFGMGDFGKSVNIGIGAYLKGLYGIAEAGQVTFTTGFSTYARKGNKGGGNYNIIPLLAGYRHNFDGFYAEPQVGYGIYNYKPVDIPNVRTGQFTWAVGFGYALNKIDVGVRYQSGHKDGFSTGLVGVHVGYNFSLGGEE